MITHRNSYPSPGYLLGFCLVLGVSSAGAQPADWDVRGEARDPATGELIYREFHYIRPDQTDQARRRQIRYYRPDQTLLANKTLTWDLGFPYLAQLHWQDHEAGVQTTSQWQAPDYQQTTQRPDTTQVQSVALDNPGEVVVDAAFDRYLRNNFDALRKDETLTFTFLSLGADRTYRFQARTTDRRNNRLQVVVEPANPVLRWLVNPIELIYATDPIQLKQFRGVTNFRRNGDLINAEIHYDYSS